MRAQALIQQLYSLRGGTRYNLERIEVIDAKFQHPHRSYPTVHIAGTNGKGSVTAKVTRILQEANYKVGTYTSPHIIDFPERIQVNGTKISYEEIQDLLDLVLPTSDLADFASFFEITTMMAFMHFQAMKVDFGVIEVGLGGRLDATNVVVPRVSVITSISLDHTDILGSTILEIASEKAGIIKPGVPCVVGPNVPIDYFREVCLKLGSPLYEVPPATGFESYAEENNRISRTVAEVLRQQSYHLTDEQIERGLQGRQPLRCYKTQYDRGHFALPLVLDVGHNPDGLQRLLSSVQVDFPGKRLRVVLGMSASKDLTQAFEVVFSFASIVHFISAEHFRLKPFNELESLGREINAEKVGVSGPVTPTLIQVLDLASEDDVVVICGSFFIMKDVYEALGPAGVDLEIC
jgi:dihydrofolate synthase/folylpolyglutamate synthase